MAKPSSPALTDDLKKVMAFFKDRNVIPASPAVGLTEIVRRIHAATYSLILWRFRLKGVPVHGRPFIEEIASDALQILPQVLLGYGKTVKLLTRGIIENILRHVYFSDHPVEFHKMNQDSKWFMPMAELFTYTKTHPKLMLMEKRFDAMNRLSTLYSDLSTGVHGQAVSDLEMRLSLEKIAYAESIAKKNALFIERCASASNFLLAVFHGQKVAKFQSEDRLIIFQTMPPRARNAWRDSL
ncbi:MAG TPA: hypothetical protein VG204_19555 [Terriglobia bacterium]|nr:hypothetical protein [Terriglobia bacterium]